MKTLFSVIWAIFHPKQVMANLLYTLRLQNNLLLLCGDIKKATMADFKLAIRLTDIQTLPPKATRFDCVNCRLRDLDGDGVPDGSGQVKGEPCIAPGRRSPWDS